MIVLINDRYGVISPEDLLRLRFSSSFDDFVDRVPNYVILSFFEQSISDLRVILGKEGGEELVVYNWFGSYVKVAFFSYNGLSLALFVLPIGISISAMLLEELIYCGASYFLVIGFAGSLQGAGEEREGVKGDRLSPWDLVVPTYSFMDDEVFYLYSGLSFSKERQYTSTVICKHLCKELDRKRVSYHKGACLTTGTPYLQTSSVIEKYSSKGVLCIDMELSSLLSVASYRSVELSALFAISDFLSMDGWVHYFKDKGIKKARTRLLHTALDISAYLCR